MRTLLYGFILLWVSHTCHARTALPQIAQGSAYLAAKQQLMAQGWQPVENLAIERSSLYAQEIHQQGLVEVVDCISMELDACRFRFKKQSQTIEIKTITRQLTVDQVQPVKK
ncbi:hypothetical protein [Methylophilus medardicus]|uniref:Uncharacterized protein n=1 Tax=Methylophilus medardicus TaxID=2588534 RepID=A0A5B8CPU8_9PROT|nr:hypothetical protein [Methylophilus medardicus]QDC43252.1 hypothetical protein FIU01_01080 [Methylophilus medardicus]QDC48259.1 hypothetical protein FIU00_01080 [Methylophilus medardicus]QDC51964.1 hypothetical protein FIT99_01080 [Methylophilus medardicus]